MKEVVNINDIDKIIMGSSLKPTRFTLTHDQYVSCDVPMTYSKKKRPNKPSASDAI